MHEGAHGFGPIECGQAWLEVLRWLYCEARGEWGLGWLKVSRLKGSWLFWRREEDLVSQLGHVSRRLRFDFARIINDRLLVGSVLYLYQIIFILKKSGAGLAGEEWLKGLFNGRREGSHGVGPCELWVSLAVGGFIVRNDEDPRSLAM